MLTIVIFALHVAVCEITTFNLPKWSQFESLTFKKVGQGHELHRRRIRPWMAFSEPYKMVRMADISKAVFD